MKKQTTKTLVICFSLLCLLAVYAVPASAMQVSPSSVGTNGVTTTLKISDGDQVYCRGTVSLKSGYTASTTLTLQRKSSGSWSSVNSWSGTGSMTKYQYVSSGYSYRTKFVVKVKKNGTTVETITKYSSTVSY